MGQPQVLTQAAPQGALATRDMNYDQIKSAIQVELDKTVPAINHVIKGLHTYTQLFGFTSILLDTDLNQVRAAWPDPNGQAFTDHARPCVTWITDILAAIKGAEDSLAVARDQIPKTHKAINDLAYFMQQARIDQRPRTLPLVGGIYSFLDDQLFQTNSAIEGMTNEARGHLNELYSSYYGPAGGAINGIADTNRNFQLEWPGQLADPGQPS